MPRGLRKQTLPEYITLALLLAGFAVLFQQQGWLWRWDQNIYDSQLRFWSRPAADNIIIIAIDEDSLAQFGRWPWTRQVHAHLLKKISPIYAQGFLVDTFPAASRPVGLADALELCIGL